MVLDLSWETPCTRKVKLCVSPREVCSSASTFCPTSLATSFAGTADGLRGSPAQNNSAGIGQVQRTRGGLRRFLKGISAHRLPAAHADGLVGAIPSQIQPDRARQVDFGNDFDNAGQFLPTFDILHRDDFFARRRVKWIEW